MPCPRAPAPSQLRCSKVRAAATTCCPSTAGPGLGARGHRGQRRGGRFPHVRREGRAAAKQLPRRPLESGAGGRGLGADPRTPGCCSRRFQRNLRGPPPGDRAGAVRDTDAEGGRGCCCPTLAPLPCCGRRARPGESAPRRGGAGAGRARPALQNPPGPPPAPAAA